MPYKIMFTVLTDLLIGQKLVEKERRDAINQNLYISHVISLSLCFVFWAFLT